MRNLADLRLLRDRDGLVRLGVDGRRLVAVPAGPDLVAQLRALADRLEAASWASGADPLDLLGDPASPLFTGAAPEMPPRPTPREPRARGSCRRTTKRPMPHD